MRSMKIEEREDAFIAHPPPYITLHNGGAYLM